MWIILSELKFAAEQFFALFYRKMTLEFDKRYSALAKIDTALTELNQRSSERINSS